jgi:anti-anti-sigma factor
MEISSHKTGDVLVLRLAGRLDANWCGHVQEALATAVKEGEHRLHLDMSSVNYLSSAGIRVLITFYKQLRAINGELGVVNPSAVVRSVLDLSGLGMLIASGATAAPVAVETGDEAAESKATARAVWKIYHLPTSAASMRLAVTGDASVLAGGAATPLACARSFGENMIALGVGELGVANADHVSRAGEFLAVAGVAAFQPADGSSSRPDFMMTEGSLAPQGQLVLGICGEGGFAKLLRFEATAEGRTVGLTELAQMALEASGASAVVIAGVTETAGLVGATLRKSPAMDSATNASVSATGTGLGARFAFPQIRDWLSFTSERAFRDSTSLFVGVAARRGTGLDPLLRPMARGSDLVGHFHAAVFPYRPLRKGPLELKASVAELFEGQPPQAILHLLADSRGFNGAGESEFLRGALWMAPVTNIANGSPAS